MYLTVQVALKNGTTLHKCLQLLKEARSKGLTVPVVLMGYTNPFVQYGTEKLTKEAKDAGLNPVCIIHVVRS